MYSMRQAPWPTSGCDTAGNAACTDAGRKTGRANTTWKMPYIFNRRRPSFEWRTDTVARMPVAEHRKEDSCSSIASFIVRDIKRIVLRRGPFVPGSAEHHPVALHFWRKMAELRSDPRLYRRFPGTRSLTSGSFPLLIFFGVLCLGLGSSWSDPHADHLLDCAVQYIDGLKGK